jgi:hypothetical protein
MNSKDWYRGLEHPESLGAVEAAWLKQAVEEYPYSAPLHALYARALKNEGHYLAPQALRRAAAVAPDRRALMLWMEDFSVPTVSDAHQPSETEISQVPPVALVETPSPLSQSDLDSVKTIVAATQKSVGTSESSAFTAHSSAGSDVSHLPAKVQEAILRARAISAKFNKFSSATTAPEVEPQAPAVPVLQNHSPVATNPPIAPLVVASEPPTTSAVPESSVPQNAVLPQVSSELNDPPNVELSPFARWLADQTATAHPIQSSEALDWSENPLDSSASSPELGAGVTVPTVPKPLADALIDKFLEREAPVRPAAVPGRGSELRAPMPDLSASSLGGDPVFMTETLAQVYVQQGAFDKAVQAYEILRLKYPDKSAIFASLILEIRLKQRNKKP